MNSFLVLASSMLFAAWNPVHVDWTNKINEDIRFPNGNAMTYWGGVQVAAKVLTIKKLSRLPLHSPSYGKSPLQAGLVLQLKKKKIVRAPLVIILPGVFGSLDDPNTKWMAHTLERVGNHVLALSNPWSKDYQAQNPDAVPGEIEIEARVVLEALDFVHATIGKDKISKISIIGVSYGGILATVVKAIDSQKVDQKIEGHLTVLSPPLRMAEAITALDSLKDDNLFEYCLERSNWNYGFNYLIVQKQSRLRKRDVACAGYLLSEIFRDELIYLARSIHIRKSVGRLPDPSLTFEEFRRDYLLPISSVPEFDAPEGNWEYWLGKLSHQERSDSLRVMTAQDDFLNDPDYWQELIGRGLLPEKSFMTLSWGGHFGYIGLPSFDEFLESL